MSATESEGGGDRRWRWQDGAVDRDRAHIELRHGDAGTTPYEAWRPVALVGTPTDHVFPVSWLIAPVDADTRRMVAAAKEELDFYLVEKGEPDPWDYAQYHCGTGANMYSSIHWSYFPDGEHGERHSSLVTRLPDEPTKLSE